MDKIKFQAGYDNVVRVYFGLKKFINENPEVAVKYDDILDKMKDFVSKVSDVSARIKHDLDLNKPEEKLAEVVSRFFDWKQFENLSSKDAAYEITKGIYYPLPRR